VSKELLVETVTGVGRWNWQEPDQLVRKVAGMPGRELLKQSLPSLKVGSGKAVIQRALA